MESLRPRAIIGAYHKVSVTNREAYLDEVAFRFSNRGNAFLFRDTILALVREDALPYQQLINP